MIIAGTRKDGRAVVTFVDGGENHPLNPRYDLANHSPDGFEWGYAGSGPSQLALAILALVLNDDARALRLYQSFKDKIIAGIDDDDFDLAGFEVLDAVTAIEKETA